MRAPSGQQSTQVTRQGHVVLGLLLLDDLLSCAPECQLIALAISPEKCFQLTTGHTATLPAEVAAPYR